MRKRTSKGRNEDLCDAVRGLLSGLLRDRGRNEGFRMDIDFVVCKIHFDDDTVTATAKDANGRNVVVAEYELRYPPARGTVEVPKGLLRQLVVLAELGVEHRDFPSALPPGFRFPKGAEHAEDFEKFGKTVVLRAKLCGDMKVVLEET